MKNALKSIFRPFIKNNISWSLLKPIAALGSFMKYERTVIESKGKFDYLFTDLKVQNGPFKGLTYPSLDFEADLLYPKLIGSYEQEIHDCIDELCAQNYAEIINIGCAEGYYAVGMAMRMPETTVYAYDTDEKEQKLCREMAALNKVNDRVIIGGEYTATDLGNRSFEGKTLIVCDCEGAEKYLFTPQNIGNLKHCDFLIEMHDCFDMTISTYLTNLLQDTHRLEFVKSIDAIEKAKTYDYVVAKDLSLEEKREIYSENRITIMEWMIAWAKEPE
ncbi:MAG: hypothetical protein R3E32_10110 [Chitinophagales bacterium]